MCQSLMVPAGGVTASLGGRGLRVTSNTDDDTGASPPASIVVSGSPAVGKEAAARASKVPVHTRASRPCPP